eukprot:CAMPEP_0195508146 /NCGR_PEP_ID=MMETSP0794_2-20130614/1439_1 /TAXON_ID=515487 /ORGANISM="Stephanopyxis turris, Strain CCMP 815" /LENGTH=367 /DNA_ID=CAMNT_0040635035 /DNA_START=18 /DNA_END=1121 /DNA_ORIENTATION=+
MTTMIERETVDLPRRSILRRDGSSNHVQISSDLPRLRGGSIPNHVQVASENYTPKCGRNMLRRGTDPGTWSCSSIGKNCKSASKISLLSNLKKRDENLSNRDVKMAHERTRRALTEVHMEWEEIQKGLNKSSASQNLGAQMILNNLFSDPKMMMKNDVDDDFILTRGDRYGREHRLNSNVGSMNRFSMSNDLIHLDRKHNYYANKTMKQERFTSESGFSDRLHVERPTGRRDCMGLTTDPTTSFGPSLSGSPKKCVSPCEDNDHNVRRSGRPLDRVTSAIQRSSEVLSMPFRNNKTRFDIPDDILTSKERAVVDKITAAMNDQDNDMLNRNNRVQRVASAFQVSSQSINQRLRNLRVRNDQLSTNTR